MPLDEIAQDVIELDATLGPEVDAVHERLCNTPEPGLQFAILCEFTRKRVSLSRSEPKADAIRAVRTLGASHGAARIEDLCRSLRVSRKHLRMLFLAHVGLPPKTYARMFRFRRVVDLVQARRTPPDWAQLAMSCGYYDQAHFNREFREFAGLTPNEFARSGSVDGLTILEG
jgi:methylphosphotriester-DNA--protein-cysteine methyltransferase